MRGNAGNGPTFPLISLALLDSFPKGKPKGAEIVPAYIGSQHAAAAEREGLDPSCRDERIAFRLSRRGTYFPSDTPAVTAVLRFWVSNIIFEEDNES